MSARRPIHQLLHALVLSLGAALALGVASPAAASGIHYGSLGPDFPPGVTMYLDIQEASGTDPVPPPLYGPPTLSGDVLDFNPAGFVASATAGSADITDGQLNFDIMVLEEMGIVAGGLTSLLLSESGEFSLFGAGTALTSVAGGLSIDIDILEVDGNPIAPISVFASNSISRDLVADGPAVLAPWSNGVLVELLPVLVSHEVEFTYGVTKARVVIDDQLIAISESGSVSFIAKKDFTITPGIDPNPDFPRAPEPASALLLLGGLAVLRGRLRRTAAA